MARKKQPLRVYFDADYLVYTSGYAVEKTDYALLVGESLHGVYEGKEALNAGRAKILDDEGDEVRVFSRTYLEGGDEQGLIRAKHNIKSQIEGVETAITKRYPKRDTEWTFVLTGGGQFRDVIATIRPYKGNRSTRPKPLLYHALREYLCEVWGAYIVKGYEADDEVAILQTEKPGVLVHVDKDLMQVPGLHYVPGKGWANLGEMQALRYFYRQVITGDSADNVGGVYKAGPARAKEVITKGMTEDQMIAACLLEYNASIAKYGEKCGYEDAARAYTENRELLWLVRKREDLPRIVRLDRAEAVPTLQRPARPEPVPAVAAAAQGLTQSQERQSAYTNEELDELTEEMGL